jgi:hypothetical protein
VQNPVADFLGRFQIYRIASRFSSTLRGAVCAQKWADLKGANLNITSPSVANNPLRSYFDSVKQGRGIWKWIHYFDIYDRHFRQFVGKEVHVVEVGIYSGGSLDMWKYYFGSRCSVFGIDIEPACKAYEADKTRVFIGDQSDRDFWREFRKEVPKVDILIDDGGHIPEQQIVTLEEMLPHISPGGVYMCEDVHGEHNRFAAYVSGLGQALNAAKRCETQHEVLPSSFQKFIASIHQYPFVTVIEKTSSPVTRFIAPKHGTEWQPFL